MTSTTTGGPEGLSVTEVVESLTGHDELAIEKQFGKPVEELGGAKFIRALLFGHFLHAGIEAKAAHKQVMNMTQAAVGEYFRDEEDDDAGTPPAPPAAPPTAELGHAATGAGAPLEVVPPDPDAPVPDAIAETLPSGRRPIPDSPQA
jgi:hypothetical protein